MTLDHFNQACDAAHFPRLTPAQWAQLVQTLAGAALVDLEHFCDAADLELFVRSVQPTVQQTLEELGYQFDLSVLLDAALRERKGLFIALHKARTDAAARDYIARQGFKRMDKIPTPAPYYNFHVYSTKAALCISEARTRVQQRATINIEGAHALSGNRYDWQQKMTMQLSPEEMFIMLALFNRKIVSLKFAGHGRQHDKLLEGQVQDSHFFFRMVQRGRSPIAIPVSVADSLNWTSLLYQQIKLNHPHLVMDELNMMQQQLIAMYKP
ncbi:hypothetical protein [Undibacterium oligocarboniphilum]|uniref:Uncharacterized protein n=1 Tax=Undibacterium oligocarboniphilum TaxID=666702 RepID=A0A850QJD7_9BURK|nr:hypothetical protein [Undibacterium oligocarboniphilum]MBC3871732.1 hypothetical protein [Undibacterium oligocarboniphilum]NVO79368.1 hypothetical protein [Undibacterium oligocarboniphilum]